LADDLKIKYKMINLPLFQTNIPSGVPQTVVPTTPAAPSVGGQGKTRIRFDAQGNMIQ